MKTINVLIKKAMAARNKAYAPYSKFKVGAVIETAGGKIFTGCNIENSSSGATVCAERTAIVKAVSEGSLKFKRIVVIANTKKPCPPCGICRQVLLEFSPNIEVIMANTKGDYKTFKLSELMPHPFTKIFM